MNKSDTLIVMGNGPSLADVDFNMLDGYDTFGLNSAYRAYRRLDWWPTYHGCFDYRVTDSHKEEFIKLIEEGNSKSLAAFLYENRNKLNKDTLGDFFGNEKSFLQLNMSEYQDKTGISKLMGANAGYIGYEEGGLLTEFVRNNPNCVILFDEVENVNIKF